MKRLTACILMLTLCALLLPAGAEGLWGLLFGGSAGPAIRFEPLPEEIFITENTRVIGADGEGRMLLMTNTQDLWLWDRLESHRVPVSFARQEDAEVIGEACINLVLQTGWRDLKKDERTAKRQELADRQAAWLAERGQTVFANLDQISELYDRLAVPGFQILGLNERYALVAMNRLAGALALDLATGKAFLIPGQRQPTALRGKTVLTMDGLVAADTGEDLAAGWPDHWQEEYGWCYPAALSGNDTALFIATEKSYSPEEQEIRLAAVSAGSVRALTLGRAVRQPRNVLVSADGGHALVYNNALRHEPAWLVNLESGEIVELRIGQYMPVAAAEVGFLCMDIDAWQPVILDPEDGTPQAVALNRGFDWSVMDMVAMSSLVRGANGRFFCSAGVRGGTAYVHGYFVLDGE